jgi:HK97 family phage prohead protease
LEFKIYTNALKAYETEDGERYVAGTTSSTIRDLHGDEMSLDALKTMAETARQNMTVFLNHNYNVPEDLFGSATSAEIVKRYDRETNEEVYDLDLNIRVVNEDENPEALRAYRAIKRGVKLGLSIGARVEKARRKAAEGDKPESIVIEKVRLLEASVVGIPANQRSYLQNAIKSLKSAPEVDSDVFSEPSDETKAYKHRVGEMVSWGSSGGRATGKITRIVSNGKLEVPDSSFTINGTPEDPAVLIRVYRDGKPTETLVGHKMSTLRSAKDATEIIDSIKAVDIEGNASPEVAPLAGSPYNLLIEEGTDVEDTDEEDDSAEKSAVKSFGFGDFVAWQNTDGPGGYGEVEQVVKDGSVVVPKTNEEFAAVPNDPAILVRVWAQKSGDGYKPTSEFIGLLSSMVKKVKGPGEGAEDAPSQTATQIPGLEILPPGTVPGGASAQEKSMDIEEKKTRVTVTVSTDADDKQPAAASVAPSAPDAAAAETNESPEEIKASGDDVADGEVNEKVDDVEDSAEEEKEAVDPAIEALQELGAELVPAEAEKSLTDESAAQPEMAEAEVFVVETDGSSFEEVESIAKSALDAANAAQEEVAAVSAKVTELLESKAKVEQELAKALELIDRISELGIGRKSFDKQSQKVNVKAAEKAPWLSPYVQRVLEAQDEE